MNLKRLFDSDEEGVDFTNPVYSEDCTSIAAVLKIYLRELPQPLFPFALNERIAYSCKAIFFVFIRKGHCNCWYIRLTFDNPAFEHCSYSGP